VSVRVPRFFIQLARAEKRANTISAMIFQSLAARIGATVGGG